MKCYDPSADRLMIECERSSDASPHGESLMGRGRLLSVPVAPAFSLPPTGNPAAPANSANFRLDFQFRTTKQYPNKLPNPKGGQPDGWREKPAANGCAGSLAPMNVL